MQNAQLELHLQVQIKKQIQTRENATKTCTKMCSFHTNPFAETNMTKIPTTNKDVKNIQQLCASATKAKMTKTKCTPMQKSTFHMHNPAIKIHNNQNQS